MTDTTETRFRRELSSFFAMTLLNVVFAVQAIGLGVAYIVGSVLGTTALPTPALRALVGALALVSLVLGLAWMRASARVLRGVALIRRPFRRRRGPASEEDVTRGIVGLVAHYREHRRTIRTMIVVCVAGGLVFLAQGVLAAVESASVALGTGSVTVNALALVPAALISLVMGLVALLSSYYFSRFSRAWDLRLEETARAEEQLKVAMELDAE
ncbi:MAG: hypothetical protein ABFC89_07880 [Methanospirillum sp.]